MFGAGDAGALARRVRDSGTAWRAMVRQAEAEQEVIQAGVVAAFGDGAPVVEVVVFGDEGVIERPRLPASERADALMAALDEREEGVRERVDQAGRDAVDAGMRSDPWDVPVIELPEFDLTGLNRLESINGGRIPPRAMLASATGTDTAVASGLLLLGGALYFLSQSVRKSRPSTTVNTEVPEEEV